MGRGGPQAIKCSQPRRGVTWVQLSTGYEVLNLEGGRMWLIQSSLEGAGRGNPLYYNSTTKQYNDINCPIGMKEKPHQREASVHTYFYKMFTRYLSGVCSFSTTRVGSDRQIYVFKKADLPLALPLMTLGKGT